MALCPGSYPGHMRIMSHFVLLGNLKYECSWLCLQASALDWVGSGGSWEVTCLGSGIWKPWAEKGVTSLQRSSVTPWPPLMSTTWCLSSGMEPLNGGNSVTSHPRKAFVHIHCSVAQGKGVPVRYLWKRLSQYFGTRLRELLLGSADFSPLEFMKGEHSGTSHSRTSHALHEDH